MEKVIQNCISSTVEEQLAVEQAGFTPDRNTVNQISNCHILMEKQVIEALCKSSPNAGLLSIQIGDFFPNRRHPLKVPTISSLLLNIFFLENIMCDHYTSIYIDCHLLKQALTENWEVLPTDWQTVQIHAKWRLALTRLKSWPLAATKHEQSTAQRGQQL